jgi:hypothetical protein
LLLIGSAACTTDKNVRSASPHRGPSSAAAQASAPKSPPHVKAVDLGNVLKAAGVSIERVTAEAPDKAAGQASAAMAKAGRLTIRIRVYVSSEERFKARQHLVEKAGGPWPAIAECGPVLVFAEATSDHAILGSLRDRARPVLERRYGPC